MRPEDVVFLAISFVLIALWTGYRIWVFRKGVRLRRELEKLLEK